MIDKVEKGKISFRLYRILYLIPLFSVSLLLLFIIYAVVDWVQLSERWCIGGPLYP